MQLVIAEKPSVARDLARVLGMRGGGKHAIDGPGRVITWCIGHLVELEEPAAYDAAWKAWRLDTLPMLPGAFKLRPVPGTRDQLGAVRDLLRDRRFDEVVNACDAGREGELIFRYVYELAGCRLPIKRLWISSLTDESIRAGFARLRPGVELDALAAAARCRSEADWLVGMNATRAVTVSSRAAAPRPAVAHPPRRGRAAHSDSPLYSIGRVQTPTLAILVRRELEIRQFRPRDYWEVRGLFVPLGAPADSAEKVTATWGIALPDAKAIRSRLAERTLAEGIVARGELAAGGPHAAIVETLRQKRVREPPPLLFDLTSLQRTANRRYGLSATATLAAAQALYERYKILTYPRTDSRHLTSDMAKELPKLFGALAALPDYARFAQPLLETPPPQARRVFDGSKVSDHHAIVPTGKPVRLDDLPRDERRVFDLVARRFLGAFHPDAEFALTDVVVRVGAPTTEPRAAADPREVESRTDEALLTALPPPPDRYRAHGRVRLVAGWQEVAAMGGDAADAEGGPTLPPLVEGQRLDGKLDVVTKQTRPPPRHTEATLLGAMESAGRDISDAALRAAMRDSGLGTPATRAATIETLIRRTFVARDGKNLVADRPGDRAHRRPSGEEPGLARADRDLGGASFARGARRGDARRVHGGHLTLRERRRGRDPPRRRRWAGPRRDAPPRTAKATPAAARAPRRDDAHVPALQTGDSGGGESWAGAAPAGARGARS